MDKLMRELIDETAIEDIPRQYRPVAEIIGVEMFAELSCYAMGDNVYFPSLKRITAPARNRRIVREYDGSNIRMLAQKYGVTVKQAEHILKGPRNKK